MNFFHFFSVKKKPHPYSVSESKQVSFLLPSVQYTHAAQAWIAVHWSQQVAHVNGMVPTGGRSGPQAVSWCLGQPVMLCGLYLHYLPAPVTNCWPACPQHGGQTAGGWDSSASNQSSNRAGGLLLLYCTAVLY